MSRCTAQLQMPMSTCMLEPPLQFPLRVRSPPSCHYITEYECFRCACKAQHPSARLVRFRGLRTLPRAEPSLRQIHLTGSRRELKHQSTGLEEELTLSGPFRRIFLVTQWHPRLKSPLSCSLLLAAELAGRIISSSSSLPFEDAAAKNACWFSACNNRIIGPQQCAVFSRHTDLLLAVLQPLHFFSRNAVIITFGVGDAMVQVTQTHISRA